VILPPPATTDCTLGHIERYLDRMNAARGGVMPNPTGGEDWHSQDDPPPRKPEPKPEPSKAT
jgi:hypothetical protein